VATLLGQARLVDNRRLHPAVPLERRQRVLPRHCEHRLVTPGRVGDELLQRVMFGLDSIRRHRRRHRLHTLAFDGQQQPRAVIPQRCGSIRVSDRLSQQRHVLIEPLLACCFRCDLFGHSSTSSYLNKKCQDFLTQWYYLISAFGQTTATGLSALFLGAISHDRVQRFLAGPQRTSADLWLLVKPHVRQMESEDGVMIVDDSIAEKPYTDENEIVCWHYDHSKQRHVKGINFVSCLYHSRGMSLPVGFEIVRKSERYTDPKDGKQKRRSDKTTKSLAISSTRP